MCSSRPKSLLVHYLGYLKYVQAHTLFLLNINRMFCLCPKASNLNEKPTEKLAMWKKGGNVIEKDETYLHLNPDIPCLP